MTENNEQPINQEAQAEGKMAGKFREARERTMKEAGELGEIYRAMTKPGFKDVYNAWVKNMDVVANTYSWGREKPGTKTRIIKVLNRIVGATAAAITVPMDFVADVLSWLPRQVPIVGHFIPTHFLARHTVHMSGWARNEALISRGVVGVVDAPFKIAGGVVKSAVTGFPEVRAGVTYAWRKAGEVTKGIFHPKQKLA